MMGRAEPGQQGVIPQVGYSLRTIADASSANNNNNHNNLHWPTAECDLDLVRTRCLIYKKSSVELIKNLGNNETYENLKKKM